MVEAAYWKLYVTSALLPGQKDFVIDDGIYKKPTFKDPTEVAVLGSTMMAVLRRAELFDPVTNEILASFSSGADYPVAPVAGARVLLGVTCIPINKELYDAARMEDEGGCMIGSVTPGSVAMQVALQPGDVLLALNSNKVNTPTELVELVKGISPGRTVSLKVWRGGREVVLQAKF